MSSPPTIEPFNGTNWDECKNFIRAIRAAAWKEGRFRDFAWVADFAALHFSHKALTWHSRLPRDIRQDWEKLEVALIDRWASPEDDDEPRIEPTPAAAASLNRKDRVGRPLQGVLKVVMDGSDTNFYLKRGDGYGVTTEEAKEATRFRCSSLSNTTILERIDGSRPTWLAIQWVSGNPDPKEGPTDYGRLVFVDSITLKSSASGLNTPYQLAKLSADGEVIPVWENKGTSQTTFGILRTLSGRLTLVEDPDASSRMDPSLKSVKIFIEPID